MLRLFVGLDPDELVGFHVFVQSVLSRTDPNKVSIIPVCGSKDDASTSFSKARFEIPERCGFRGRAVWADGSDMLCRADILELPDLLPSGRDVAVVPHDYSTKYPRKFLGQPNEDYEKKNWSSLMVLDCGNALWRRPAYRELLKGPAGLLHRFAFIEDERISFLPMEWNWLVGEYEYNQNAKIAHFTIGGPWWPEYRDWDYSDEWFKELGKVNHFRASER